MEVNLESLFEEDERDVKNTAPFQVINPSQPSVDRTLLLPMNIFPLALVNNSQTLLVNKYPTLPVNDHSLPPVINPQPPPINKPLSLSVNNCSLFPVNNPPPPPVNNLPPQLVPNTSIMNRPCESPTGTLSAPKICSTYPQAGYDHGIFAKSVIQRETLTDASNHHHNSEIDNERQNIQTNPPACLSEFDIKDEPKPLPDSLTQTIGNKVPKRPADFLNLYFVKVDWDHDENAKPPFSYAQLVVQAIASAPDREMTLNGICDYIMENYPFYKNSGKQWQYMVRRCIVTSIFFVKAKGRVNFLRIDPKWEAELMAQAFKREGLRGPPCFKIPVNQQTSRKSKGENKNVCKVKKKNVSSSFEPSTVPPSISSMEQNAEKMPGNKSPNGALISALDKDSEDKQMVHRPVISKENQQNESKAKRRKNRIKSIFQCGICKKTFSQSKLLMSHLKEHTDNRPHECDVCGRVFKTSRGLISHHRIHSNKIFPRKICGKSFYYLYRLKIHTEKHNNEKPYKCSVCEKGFSINSSLKSHILIHSDDRPYICEVCGQGFKQPSGYRSHVARHKRATGEKQDLCDVSENENNNSYHLKTQTNKTGKQHKQYEAKCDYCGKQLSSFRALAMHIRTHTGEKPYKCDVCGKSFSQQSCIYYHKATHTDMAEYYRAIKREKYRQRGRDYYSWHRFQCDRCGILFKTPSNLKRHIQVNHSIIRTQYKCKVCGLALASLRSFRNHTSLHTGEREFECGICGMKYIRPGYLKQHLKIHNCF